jgi:protein-tyrosine phosphatase
MIAAVWDHADLRPGDAADDYLFRRYRDMLDEGRPVITRVIELLAEPNRFPFAFYCAAGKDRTGVLASLILGLLGVPDDEIVGDYHLSAERVQRIVAQVRARPQRETAMVEQPPELLSAPPEAMRLLLGWMRERYGSVAGCVEELGIGPDTVTGVRDNLLTPLGSGPSNDR